MTDREMIEARCEREGFTITSWRTDDFGVENAVIGRFKVVTADEEDTGLYEGDLGELTACVVGAAKYGNQRVAFSFAAEGYDEGNEVRDLHTLDPVA